MNHKILEVENLFITINGNHILEDINFKIEAGTITAVIGPNGAGKSMLFKSLLGIIPYEGNIHWEDENTIGYVPQKFNVDRGMPLTVLEFFKLKTDKEEDIFKILKDIGISDDEHHAKHHILNKRLGILSGGEQQKILIAWAMLNNPKILLFDEPTSGIDIGAEDSIYKLLKKLHDKRNITVIFISHDINIIQGYADNVICLNKKMICYGGPTETINEKTLGKLYGGDSHLFTHRHNTKLN